MGCETVFACRPALYLAGSIELALTGNDLAITLPKGSQESDVGVDRCG